MSFGDVVGGCLAVGTLVGGATKLFAQAGADMLPGAGVALESLTPITSVGFAVWYGWHTTSRTIPKMIETHSSAVEKLTQMFLQAATSERDFHHTQTELLRDRLHETANQTQALSVQLASALDKIERIERSKS